MPEYGGLKAPKNARGFTPKERLRTAKNLRRLRKQLKKEIPPKTLDDTLLVATWNVRELGYLRGGRNSRIDESYYYIAEILASFDIVALQEIGRDLRSLKRVLDILGTREYEYMVTDVNVGRYGNMERLGIVYDKRKAVFQNITGQIVLPENRLIQGEHQFARAPFLVGFQSGWFRFALCNVHLFFGGIGPGKKLERRLAEIKQITEFIAKLATRKGEDEFNYIVLGDFNVVDPRHVTMATLKESGFEMLDELKRPTSISGKKYYDQIIFKPRKNELRLGDSNNNAGVFNYFKSVFRDDDFETYADYIKESRRKFKNDGDKRKYYLTFWRTFQMSDHFPLWVELKIDFSKEYLEESMEVLKLEGEKKTTKK